MGAKRLTMLTGGRNVLNWDKSSQRRGRNVLKMGAKRLGGRNVYGAKCPGAPTIYPGIIWEGGIFSDFTPEVLVLHIPLILYRN